MAKSKLLGDDFFRMRPMPGGQWYVAADRRRDRSPNGRPGRALFGMMFGEAEKKAPVRGAPLPPRGPVLAIPKAEPATPAARKRVRVNKFPSFYLDIAPEGRFQAL